MMAFAHQSLTHRNALQSCCTLCMCVCSEKQPLLPNTWWLQPSIQWRKQTDGFHAMLCSVGRLHRRTTPSESWICHWSLQHIQKWCCAKLCIDGHLKQKGGCTLFTLAFADQEYMGFCDTLVVSILFCGHQIQWCVVSLCLQRHQCTQHLQNQWAAHHCIPCCTWHWSS